MMSRQCDRVLTVQAWQKQSVGRLNKELFFLRVTPVNRSNTRLAAGAIATSELLESVTFVSLSTSAHPNGRCSCVICRVSFLLKPSQTLKKKKSKTLTLFKFCFGSLSIDIKAHGSTYCPPKHFIYQLLLQPVCHITEPIWMFAHPSLGRPQLTRLAGIWTSNAHLFLCVKHRRSASEAQQLRGRGQGIGGLVGGHEA